MRLAVVVPRYGVDLSGGTDRHARDVAQRLARHADVEVLTTCALDSVTWQNRFAPGTDRVNNLTVRRFPVLRERNTDEFNRRQLQVFDRPHSIADELAWLESAGPNSPALIKYIRANARTYDYFIFFSYRYYPAYHGIRAVSRRAVLVPTAERDPAVGLAIFGPVFRGVRAIMGEFNWSSQHLDDEVLRCRDGNGEGQTGRVGLRCVRLVGRRQRGVRSSNGSGRRSRGGCRVRMPLCPVACRRPWVVGGSVRAVVCRRSAWRPDRLATCPLRSGKRSRSCALRAPGCVTLPVGSGEPRRLSRESYVATRRLGAAVWRRLRSGTAPDVPRARRSPSWPRTIG